MHFKVFLPCRGRVDMVLIVLSDQHNARLALRRSVTACIVVQRIPMSKPGASEPFTVPTTSPDPQKPTGSLDTRDTIQ